MSVLGFEYSKFRSVARYLISGSLYVVTGVVQIICMQALMYEGGGGGKHTDFFVAREYRLTSCANLRFRTECCSDRDTFLISIPNYLGNVLVFFAGEPILRLFRNASRDSKEETKPKSLMPKLSMKAIFHPERRKLFITAFNELIAFAVGLLGLSYAGSGLYQIVHSGSTVSTAILTTICLKKRLTIMQWMFVATITIGLVIAAEQPDVPKDSYATVINGVIFTLTSCLFYSLNYVVVEYFLSSSSGESTSFPPPTGPELSLYTHGTCLVVFCIYIGIHTVPNWTQLVTKSIEVHHGNSFRILGLYFGIFASSFLHAIAYYDVIASLGAVYIGIMGAVRSVSVFAASAMFFCELQVSILFTSGSLQSP
uniref:EamA domain-containing protein n=1 Tax=Rhodosorus marinus TaxID=101924 RepID=A0A7S0BGI9_9RHOD|mmetsp:Transcript_14622/g.21391  ORF Transcript_14622/g.21391 Transcript_14622/m.21391 type:complete len:368 (+) Transcript_14622:621-1724(+)